MGDRVAVVGAGGFVGARALALLARRSEREVVAVVRSYASIARVANRVSEYRIADAEQPDALRRAFAGCDAVVDLAKPTPDRIVPTTANLYGAARDAGARLFVHLSSGTVHMPIARADLPDDAPPRRDLWMPYAREKARADEYLRERMASPEGCAIVVLRPTLIWGPGSPYVLDTATALASGSAFVIGDGDGVCDLMYVDDLARCLDAVVAHAAPRSGFYNVGDEHAPTWAEYYAAIASGLGVDVRTIRSLATTPYRPGLRDSVEAFRAGRAYRWLKTRVPLETREMLKRRMRRRRAMSIGPATPQLTREMWQLQSARYRLPTAQFTATFGSVSRTSFEDALSASLAWLRFIGVGDTITSAAPAEQSVSAIRSLA